MYSNGIVIKKLTALFQHNALHYIDTIRISDTHFNVMYVFCKSRLAKHIHLLT